VSLTGGDIYQTLGSPRPVPADSECTLLPIDALQVRVLGIDGSEQYFVAASRIEIGNFLSPIGHNRFVCVTNGGIVDGRNFAPRAHPNDGRFDVLTIDASMTFRSRLLARKKAETGTHLPHPEISVRQNDAYSTERTGKRERLSIDGIVVANWSEVFVTIIPDYWQVVV
jgi:diacylglycerol kinase family enzyme